MLRLLLLGRVLPACFGKTDDEEGWESQGRGEGECGTASLPLLAATTTTTTTDLIRARTNTNASHTSDVQSSLHPHIVEVI